ncbi:MAG: choice-of-anchor D domain-containing protein [Spirochaetes bacterium]|nr:choice-of-anchor D domain-containing protein [Spirochaetota bacterium]
MKKLSLLFLIVLAAVICSIALIPGYVYTSPPCGITFAPTEYDFGNVTLGSSDTTSFTITKDMWCSTSTITLSIDGADAGNFSIDSHTCTGDIDPSGSCTANIVFSPDSERAFAASLFADCTDIMSPVSANLAGTGVTGGSDTLALLMLSQNQDDSSGCDATAATGAAGKRSLGPAALGLVALMGLVLGTAAVRRRMRKR